MTARKPRYYKRDHARRRANPVAAAAKRARDRAYASNRKRKELGGPFALPFRVMCSDCMGIFRPRSSDLTCKVCRDYRKTDESKRMRRSEAARRISDEDRIRSREKRLVYIRDYKKTDKYRRYVNRIARQKRASAFQSALSAIQQKIG